MTNPEKLRLSRREDLEQAYCDFWTEVSGNAFELVRYFARQELHGGYLSKRSRPESYEPFLATARGSTFVLRSTDDSKAHDALKRWRQRGLDVPAWVMNRYRVHGVPIWKSCPFLPHVGFGEVAIDLDCHTSNRCRGLRP
jgi:hypothetical protein